MQVVRTVLTKLPGMGIEVIGSLFTVFFFRVFTEISRIAAFYAAFC